MKSLETLAKYALIGHLAEKALGVLVTLMMLGGTIFLLKMAQSKFCRVFGF